MAHVAQQCLDGIAFSPQGQASQLLYKITRPEFAKMDDPRNFRSLYTKHAQPRLLTSSFKVANRDLLALEPDDLWDFQKAIMETNIRVMYLNTLAVKSSIS